MKLKPISSILALVALLAGNCLAVTPIVEEFNGTELNPRLWFEYQAGKGDFIVSKGRLNFVTKGKPTVDDFSSIELLPLDSPGNYEDWETIVDLANISKLGPKAGCGIMVFNSSDRSDYLYVEFFGKGGISAGVVNNGSVVRGGRIFPKVRSKSGSIRIRFDVKTQLFEMSYSKGNPSKGYDWKRIGTFSPGGAGGDIQADWQLFSSESSFGIQLFGYGRSTKVEDGQVMLKKFSIKSLDIPILP